MLFQDRIVPIEWIYTPRVLSPWLHQGRPEEARDLERSLDVLGQLQNVLVAQTGPERFALVAGRRRMDAARALGWEFLSVKIISGGPSPARLFAVFVAENLHRVHLDPATVAVGAAAERRSLDLLAMEDRQDSEPRLAPLDWPALGEAATS